MLGILHAMCIQSLATGFSLDSIAKQKGREGGDSSQRGCVAAEPDDWLVWIVLQDKREGGWRAAW